MALSRKKIQSIVALQKKKAREEEKMFLIEGDKIVREFIQAGKEIVTLVAKPEFISGISSVQLSSISEVIPVSYDDLKRVSSLKTPHNAMAAVRMDDPAPIPENPPGGLLPVLDFIQDPGNFGTIIRAAAWFGFTDIVCSETCVDVYNPKVVQASMGAILHIRVHYTDIRELLSRAGSNGLPVYGTLLEGESVYEASLERKGIVLLGNESKGISEELMPLVTCRLKIPKFTSAEAGIDSLNAGMAASIIFSEFARRFR